LTKEKRGWTLMIKMIEQKMMKRRTFLRAGAVSLGLPVLNPMLEAAKGAEARRMVAMNAPLGIHTPNLFPEMPGKDYEPSPYLKPLQDVRQKFTVISGLKHPDVDGGHAAESSFLTGAAHPGHPSFKNTISVDQYAAERMGHHTRFASLVLTAGNNGLSYTRSGLLVPGESRPSKIFSMLFLEGSADQKAKQIQRIEDGQSIMDLVRDQVKQVARKVGREDHETFEQYVTGVRELEKRLVKQGEWAQKPKPQVDRKPPVDIDERENFTGRMALFYDMMFLAIQTDSTRLITMNGPGGNEVVSLKGVDDGWHNLSHHGKDPDKIRKLGIIEEEEFRLFGQFLKRLDSVKEGDNTLLDQTVVLLGSNLGNASAHNNINLPIVTAGGHLTHGQHLSFDPDNPPPLCNLFVSYLHHLGLEDDKFSTGEKRMQGLHG
jgi:hypothetical protein